MSQYTQSSRHLGARRRTVVAVAAGILAIASMPAGHAQARPASHAPSAPVLGGLTSQGLAVVVMPAPNGRRLTRVEITLELACTSVPQWIVADGGTDIRVGRGGAVRVVWTIRPSQGTNGSLLGGTDVFSGQLHRRAQTFTGTWHLRLAFSLPGGKLDGCDSGAVTFTARL